MACLLSPDCSSSAYRQPDDSSSAQILKMHLDRSLYSILFPVAQLQFIKIDHVMISPAKQAKEHQTGSEILRAVSRVSRAILLLLSFPGFAGVPFVGAPEPVKPTKESPLTAEEQLATFTVSP